MSSTPRPDKAGLKITGPQLAGLPLLVPALAWVGGIALVRTDRLAWTAVMLLAGVALFTFVVAVCRRRKSTLLAVTFLFLAGLVWGCLSLLADARLASVGEGWQQGAVEFRGEVAAVQVRQGYARLTLTQVQRDDGARLSGRIWLYVHGAAASEGFLSGNVVQARARLHVPRNHHNPGGFDFEAYCFDRHIALLGSAQGAVQRRFAGSSWLEKIRQRIRAALTVLPGSTGGVIQALLLGERSAIPQAIYHSFAATGAAHLLAISGLHIGMVTGFGFALCWWLVTRREVWIIRFPVRGFALFAGVLFAVAYATLAGWPLPTQRAAMMLVAAALAWQLRARVLPLNTLFASLMVILLLDAAAVSSLSLWLSFVATAGILCWAGEYRTQPTHLLRQWLMGLLLVTLVAGLVTLPLIAHVFGRLPIYGLPANLLMTPLYTLFILPLSLLGALLSVVGSEVLAGMVFALAADGIDVGNRCMAAMTAWPGGQLWLPELSLWLSAIYASAMLVAIRLGREHRWPAVVAMLIILTVYGTFALAERGGAETRFIVWDVGQGAASTLLLPDGKVLVVDVPGRTGSRFNGGTTVASGLRAYGLTHVDVLLISHLQSDHLGGATSLVQHVNQVAELCLPDGPAMRASARVVRLVAAVRKQGGLVRWLRQGDTLQLAGVSARVLWPPAGHVAANRNNTSLVLHMVLPDGHSLLLSGDIEASAEQALLSRATPASLRSDVLLIPHHGSATSSTPAFIAAVNPELAIAQAGFANRYGFPDTEVTDRYRKQGIKVMNTANGAVMVDFAVESGITSAYAEPVTSPRRKRALQWWRHFL